MKNRLIVLLLAVCMLLALTACGLSNLLPVKTEEPDEEDESSFSERDVRDTWVCISYDSGDGEILTAKDLYETDNLAIIVLGRKGEGTYTLGNKVSDLTWEIDNDKVVLTIGRERRKYEFDDDRLTYKDDGEVYVFAREGSEAYLESMGTAASETPDAPSKPDGDAIIELSVGRGVKGEFADDYQTDKYSFTAPGDGYYSFWTESDLDTYCYVYADKEGNEYLGYADYFGDNTDEDDMSISMNLTRGQTVYIYLEIYYTLGSYTIYADIAPEPEAPEMGVLSVGGLAYGSFIDDYQIDWYMFTAPSAGSFSFWTVSDLDTYCTVYGDPNSELYIAYADYNGDNYDDDDFLVSVDLQAGQTVYLEVQIYYTKGSYTIYADYTDNAPVTAAGEGLDAIWDGEWYGYFEVLDSYGTWADNYLIDDVYATIDINSYGAGYMYLTLSEYTIYFDIAVTGAWESGLYVEGTIDPYDGTLFDDLSSWYFSDEDWYTGFKPYTYGTFEDPEDGPGNGFDYVIYLRRYGEVWYPDEETVPPGYSDYLAQIGY